MSTGNVMVEAIAGWDGDRGGAFTTSWNLRLKSARWRRLLPLLHLELLLFLPFCFPLGLRVTAFTPLLPCSHVLAAPLPLITRETLAKKSKRY